MSDAGKAVEREIGLPGAGVPDAGGRAKDMDRGRLLKIVQRAHSRDCRRKGRRNLWIGSVCIMNFTPDRVPVDRGMKRLLNLCSRAAELDGHSTADDSVHAETVRFQPGSERLEVGLRKAEALAKLLR